MARANTPIATHSSQMAATTRVPAPSTPPRIGKAQQSPQSVNAPSTALPGSLLQVWDFLHSFMVVSILVLLLLFAAYFLNPTSSQGTACK